MLLPVKIESDASLAGADAYAAGVSLSGCPYEKGTPGYQDWMRGFLVAYGHKITTDVTERGAKAYFDGAKMTDVPEGLTANQAAMWRDGWCKALAQSYTKVRGDRKPRIAPVSLWFRVLAYEVEATDVVRVDGGRPFQVQTVQRERGYVRLGAPDRINAVLRSNDKVQVRQLPMMVPHAS